MCATARGPTEGSKLHPLSPTKDMCRASLSAPNEKCRPDIGRRCSFVYAAFLRKMNPPE